MCTRAVGGLAHYFERDGLATTSISLVRPHSERIRPPRALWVPFELGRPLGVANDPGFQRDVLRSALALSEAPAGPVLVDYPHDAPAGDEPAAWACPVAFAPPPAASASEALARDLATEAARLRPWYEQARRTRGRTTVGVSGKDVAGLETMTALLAAFARGEDAPGDPRTESDGWARPMPSLAKYIADDLRAYYFEAATAQPGRAAPSAAQLNDWLFGETLLGRVLLDVRERYLQHPTSPCAGWSGSSCRRRCSSKLNRSRMDGTSLPAR